MYELVENNVNEQWKARRPLPVAVTCPLSHWKHEGGPSHTEEQVRDGCLPCLSFLCLRQDAGAATSH